MIERILDVFYLQDIGLAAIMVIAFICAAVYDANGTEVPDVFTVTYAAFGIISGATHGRISSFFAFLMLLFMLQSWRPRFIGRINKWLLSRHGKSEEELYEEEQELHNQAECFENAHRQHFVAITYMMAFLAPCAVLWSGYGLLQAEQGMAAWKVYAAVIAAAIMVLLVLLECRAFIKSKINPQIPEAAPLEPLEPTAFGGADVIILCGMLGFYGLIPFIYGLAASLIVHVAIILILRITRKEAHADGIPMLPGLLLTAPVRVVLTLTVCVSIVDTFNWLVQT